MPAPTLPELLSTLLRRDAARPLVTFYDDASGERVELSVATFANWVAKTASLAQDELDLEPGGLVVLDLPTHWLGAVWLLAVWTVGGCVSTAPTAADAADLVVCGPSAVQQHASLATTVPVVALSLRPLGGRFADPLPAGMTDYGAVVLAQPDAFAPISPPGPDAAALRVDGRLHTQQQLITQGAAEPAVPAGGRLLTDVNPCSPEGAPLLASVLAQSASCVLVANPDDTTWQRRKDEERATCERRTDPTR